MEFCSAWIWALSRLIRSLSDATMSESGSRSCFRGTDSRVVIHRHPITASPKYVSLRVIR